MSNPPLVEAGNIARARTIVTKAAQTAWGLYTNDRISEAEHDPIGQAISVAEMGIKEVETLAAQAAELERKLGEALSALEILTKAHGDAWILLGRCDLAFELISTAKSLTTTKRTATQLRGEIKKASGG